MPKCWSVCAPFSHCGRYSRLPSGRQARATYADGLLRVADEAGQGAYFLNQTGTATGRLSSVEPNLQNIPIRTPLGREMRRFFIPENDDYVLLDADYSQIELRLLADISGDETMISAFASGADIHTSTACTVFGVEPEDVTLELRKRAKAVNFGIVYGIGDFSLAQDLASRGPRRSAILRIIWLPIRRLTNISKILSRLPMSRGM